jgi:hypothetical protein
LSHALDEGVKLVRREMAADPLQPLTDLHLQPENALRSRRLIAAVHARQKKHVACPQWVAKHAAGSFSTGVHQAFRETILADSLTSMDELTADADRAHVRRITDPQGRQWVVREKVMSYDRRSTRVLVFETQEVIRVVRVYPGDWYMLAVEELIEVSEHV